MSHTEWLIIAIVAAIALAYYWFIWRNRNKLPTPPAPTIRTIPAAPGLNPSTGDVIPNPPPAPPPTATNKQIAASQASNVVSRAAAMLNPNNQLAHVPIVGQSAVALIRKPGQIAANAVDRLNTTTSKVLEHIPVVGSTLAGPQKAISNVAHKLTSWL